MHINKNILSDSRYNYLFTVENVNGLVAAGVPFREAYRSIGMKVQAGEYSALPGRVLQHTHEGSISNLCLNSIREKFVRHWREWNTDKVEIELMSL